MGTTSFTPSITQPRPLNWGFILAMAFCVMFWAAFLALGALLVL